jgi:alpha-tubulin suppressor-like RCC1 family protein
LASESPPVDLGTGRTARYVDGGGAFSCALLDGGDVKCWGKNDLGQLGQGDTESRGDETGELGDALPPVDLGTGRKALTIGGGNTSMCALLDTHEIKCWGGNARGQLGQGDTENRGDEPGEMGDNLRAVNLGSGRTALGVFQGSAHACALLDNGDLKCWGWNMNAQLGTGGIVSRGDGPQEMGDDLPAVDTGF